MTPTVIDIFVHSSNQIEEEIEEVTEYLDEDNDQQLTRSYDESVTYPVDATVKTVVTTKTSKPTTLLSTPYSAIRGDIDCVLADISPDRADDERKVPFPEFGVDIVVRKGNSL